MKAIQIVKPNELRVIDMEKPVIDAENNVLVKIKASGICGSDVGIYHGTNAAATYPRVIGHEIVGEVAEVGPGVTDFKPIGDERLTFLIQLKHFFQRQSAAFHLSKDLLKTRDLLRIIHNFSGSCHSSYKESVFLIKKSAEIVKTICHYTRLCDRIH